MKTIILISKDNVLIGTLKSLLENFYNIIVFGTIQSAIEFIYHSIPNLLIIDAVSNDYTTIEILNTLKGDPIFTHLPVLIIMEDHKRMNVLGTVSADDFIIKSEVLSELKARVELCLNRVERVVEINPLTRLPGNISINRQIQNRLDSGIIFAIAYADLDYFKPFNDYYGFSRGDEVIKMTGRIILNTVKQYQPEGSFVGHIGGDDFVYLMDVDKIEEATKSIISSFNTIIITFYEESDRENHYITSIDREGNKRVYPIMSLSIGIATNKKRSFRHFGEMTGIASEMKKVAKNSNGLKYMIDRRQG
ncbi:MAG TPA: diguanylate cyclase [Syntrophorhabdaceae bacterium]|mgnify:CR=1 FL=1|nr:diguanylate cyclase [Syntrophorhabdaceae bacterium]